MSRQLPFLSLATRPHFPSSAAAMKPEAFHALITQIAIRDADASVIQRSDNVDRGISVIPLARFRFRFSR